MSEQQQKETLKLFDKYAEAKTWWEGLSFDEKSNRVAHSSLVPYTTIGTIHELWEKENKDKEKPEPIIYSETPKEHDNTSDLIIWQQEYQIKGIEAENKILKEALQSIANYEGQKGLSDKSILINMSVIAAIALKSTAKQQGG